MLATNPDHLHPCLHVWKVEPVVLLRFPTLAPPAPSSAARERARPGRALEHQGRPPSSSSPVRASPSHESMSRRSAATPKTITREESSRGSPHTSTPSTTSTTSVRSAKIAAVFFLDHNPPPAVSVACELYHDAEHPYVSQAPFLLLLSPIHAVDIAWLFHKHIRHGQSSSCSCTRVLAQHARAAAYFPCSTHADPSACTLTCTSASRPLQIVFIAVTVGEGTGGRPAMVICSASVA